MTATLRDFTIQDLVVGPHAQRAVYRKRTNDIKTTIHWGQRKLHLSEVEFFTLYWDPTKVPNPTCVYAGAAPGTHIELLSKMFPNFTFHLYDPGAFIIKPTARIQIFNEYFTDDVARKYSGRTDILFLSDIRTADYKALNKEELIKRGITTFDNDDQAIGPDDIIDDAYAAAEIHNEDQIWGDMNMQQSWVQIMNPEHALLKFRLPYPLDGKDVKVQYLRGVVYWQVWAPQTSTETRLKPVRNAKGVYDISEWSILEYEQWSFHHNSIVREQWRYKNIFNGTDQLIDSPELLNDFDSTAEAMILKLYLEKTGIRDPVQLYQRVKQLTTLTTVALNHNRVDGVTLAARRNSNIKTTNFTNDAFRKKRPTHVNNYQHTQIDYDTTWRSIIAPCTDVTFAVSGAGGLDHTKLVNDLTAFGMKQVNNNARQVHVSWGEMNYKLHEKGAYDTAFRNQQAALKASLGGQIQDVTDKMNLYQTMRVYYPDGLRYLPPTRAITTVNNMLIDEVVIAKPKGGFLSQGIELLTNDAELQAFRTRTKDEAIVSSYIINPLLVDGTKFHLRVYLLLYVNQGYYRAFMHDQFDVLTAAEPYQKGNWNRREIHLSGMEFTTRSYTWPNSVALTTDAAVLQRAMAAIPNVVRAAAIVAGQRIAPYPEAGAALEILGLDIMFDELGNAYLLEINSKVGFAPMIFERETHNIFSSLMFNWVNTSVILPHFGLLPAVLPLVDGKALTVGTLTPYTNLLTDLALLPLDQSNDQQVQELSIIGSTPDVFERVSEGLPWTIEYLIKIREEARAQRIVPCRNNYDWIVLYKNVVVGYVGTRAFTHGEYKGPQICYFFGSQYLSTIKDLELASVTAVIEILRALAFPGKYRLYLVVGTGIPIINSLAFNKVDEIMSNNRRSDVYYTDIMPNTVATQVRSEKPHYQQQVRQQAQQALQKEEPVNLRRVPVPLIGIQQSQPRLTTSIPPVVRSPTIAFIPPVVRSPTIAFIPPVVRSPTIASIIPRPITAIAPIPAVVRSPTIAFIPPVVRSPTIAPIIPRPIPVVVRSPTILPAAGIIPRPIGAIAPIPAVAIAPLTGITMIRPAVVAIPVARPIVTPIGVINTIRPIAPMVPISAINMIRPIVAPINIARPIAGALPIPIAHPTIRR